MTIDSAAPFEQQYETALRTHLAGRPRKHPTSVGARRLGGTAFEAGLTVLDLVRIHGRVMSAMGQSIPPDTGTKANAADD